MWEKTTLFLNLSIRGIKSSYTGGITQGYSPFKTVVCGV